MLTFSSDLKTMLDGCTTQLQWATTLKTALGDNRLLRCFRDPASNAVNPAITGVEFFKCVITGTIGISGYRIANIGQPSDVTINLAADPNSGTAALRIEGNGHWVQGSLSIDKATDFRMNFASTGVANIGVAVNISVVAPPMATSGTGYPAPIADANEPAYVILKDWRNPTNVVEAGRFYFDTPTKNWVFEDKEYAENMGDLRVTKSSQMITFGEHEFGAIRVSADSRIGSITNKTYHGVALNFKPTETNWPAYPRPAGAAGGGLRKGTRTINGTVQEYSLSNTFPEPFKGEVMTADNRLLGFIDMPMDNLPINSYELSEVPTLSKPQRLNMHCASLAIWESHTPKMSTYAKKWICGVTSDFMRPSAYKQRSASNPIYPPMYLGSQRNGANHWMALRKWPLPANKALIDADNVERAKNDPYLYSVTDTGLITPAWASFYNIPTSEYGTGWSYGIDLSMGYGYEPGAWCGHDQYSGPGGFRFDRGVVPSPMMIHVTDPNYIHLKSKTPIAEMITEWNKGYFNHAIHFFSDVKNWTTLPEDEVLSGKWAHAFTYYNDSAIFTDINHTVAMHVPRTGIGLKDWLPHGMGLTDAKGRLIWNGHSTDYYHNYSAHTLSALVYNNPLLAISAKHRYFAHIMCQQDKTKPEDIWKTFLVRDMGWTFKQEAEMWKLASEHELGISRKKIEARLEIALLGMYKNLYLPIFVNNADDTNSQTIRNLGIRTGTYNVGGQQVWGPSSFTLHYYIGHALQLWKQFGLFRVMWNKSTECRQALKMLIACLDKGAIDYYLDTDGCYSGSLYMEGVNLWVDHRQTSTNPAETAKSWADWLVRVNPKASPLEDLTHDKNGVSRGVDIGEWSRMQWPFIRRDFFADIPSDRDVNLCCTKVTNWVQVYTDHINGLIASGASPYKQASEDISAHPGIGRILPPTVLGD